MKRVFLFLLATMVITVAVSAAAQSQGSSSGSLGDYARAVKKTKSPEKNTPKVYDNDNLPADSSLSVVGKPAADTEPDKTAEAKTGDDKAAGDKKPGELKPDQSPEERKETLAAWKAKLDDQKSQLSLLTRELDVLQREHDIKATEFNGDTARRVQNPNGFAVEDAKYKKQIAEKQKEVDAAKAKLDAMQEDARKAGAPNSVAH